MSLANRINELLTREAVPERQGVWRWVSRLMPAGLTGVKIALAMVLLAEAATGDGILGDLNTQMNTVLAARFGKGLSPENAAIALAAVVVLQDGGTRGMSILQKTLEVAMKPLLKERYQKGQEDKQQEWESWLNRQREAGASEWNPDDPPPSDVNERQSQK
jgi:hypothetical protein